MAFTLTSTKLNLALYTFVLTRWLYEPLSMWLIDEILEDWLSVMPPYYMWQVAKFSQLRQLFVNVIAYSA